jgi:ParB/RepB/Spo0J family partition protein
MVEVSIDQIKPSPYQPRITFDLEDLREEIKRDGLLSPLLVRKHGAFFEVVDGERRLRVLKELGWKKVPVEIRNIDDKVARLSVYKLNKIRENYSAEEEATYFKKLADEGMKPYEIETELGVKHSWVQACLNVWKFPEDIRNNIFAPRGKTAYQVYMSDIRDLEGVINRNPDEAVAILREIINKRMTVDEKQRLVTDRAKKVDEARLKAVEQALPKIETEVSKLETPEELEAAAKALRKEAKKRRVLTPEQKAEQERIKEEKKRRSEETKKRHEEKQTKWIEQEVEKRASGLEETERRRIEEEARKKAKEELFKDRTVLREAAVRYSEVKRTEREEARSRLEQSVLPIEVTEADLVHKVIIGDAKDVLRSVPTSSIDMVVTSPPYFGLKEYEDELGINTEDLSRYLDDLKAIFKECFRVLKDGTFICVVIGQYTSEENSHFIPAHVAHVLEEIGFNYKREHIWVKPLGIQGIWNRGTTSFLQKPYPRNTMINIHHEHILVYQKGDKPTIFYGRNPLTEEEVKQYCWSVWELPVSDIKDHPAPYPEVIPFRLIKMYSYEGEVVLDPFLGSGTTVKVAKKLKRRSIGIEVSPEYLDIIKRSVGGADFLYHDAQKKLDFNYLITTVTSKPR